MKKFQVSTIVHQTSADLLTPVSAFLRLRKHFPDISLFESADFRGGHSESSYLVFDAIAEAELSADSFTVQVEGTTVHEVAFTNTTNRATHLVKESLATLFGSFHSHQKFPGIKNGFFGFHAYASVPYLENITFATPVTADEKIPHFLYRLYRYILVFNHREQKLTYLQNSIGEVAKDDFSKMLPLITSGTFHQGSFAREGERYSNLRDEDHIQIVNQCKKHIQRGDVFQIVPSRKFSQRYKGDDFQVYRALRVLNPSPYLFYFAGKGFNLIGSSPEAQIVIQENTAAIHPIAGTAFRTGNDAGDAEAVTALLADEKENAEHVMLVDLARNDLSRHCTDVVVTSYKEVEYYSHVIHLVSKVSGKIEDGSDLFSVFTDTFPAGTLTGAPKYKAMQLIDTLEPQARSFYGGSIGVVGLDGSLLQAILIRTFMSRNEVLTAQAGSGIVLDSIPEREVQEVKNKLGALFQALEIAEQL